MSKITLKDVKKLSKLSNLDISDEEATKYPEQLTESIQYVNNLKDINTDSVPENFFTTDAENVMEDDEVREEDMLKGKDAVKNAKNVKNGYFVVRRIL